MKPLLTILLLLFANYVHAQLFDDEILFKIRGTADSVSVVSKLVWPPGNEETEEEYKLQDSTMYRFVATDSIQGTVYHYETHDRDVLYVLKEGGDIDHIIDHRVNAKFFTKHTFIYKPAGSGNIPEYSTPTMYIITDAKRHTDTVLRFIGSRKVITKTIHQYDDKGKIAEEWETGISGNIIHRVFEYGLYGLRSKSTNYHNDTLSSTDTYTYVFDSHGNFIKRKQYTNGRIINVLYRRIYYN